MRASRIAAAAAIVLAAGTSGSAGLASSSLAPSGVLVSMAWRNGAVPSPGGGSLSVDLTVYRDGRSRLIADHPRKPPNFRLPASMQRALRKQLATARFATLRSVYVGLTGGTRTVRYAGRTVRLEKGSLGPPRLRPVVALLDRVIASRGAWEPGP